MDWTKEQRIAASRKLAIKKFGEDDASEAEHHMWAQRTGDIAEAITLQCEVTALREALEKLREESSRTHHRRCKCFSCKDVKELLTQIPK